jgi:hypothetical protein
MGNVIAMQSVSKVALSGALAEKDMESFTKALAVVKKLTACTASERIRTLENWFKAGLITAAECTATLEFYEYRRGE